MKALAAVAILVGVGSAMPAAQGQPRARSCDTARTKPLIGKARIAAVEAQARRSSQAALVRWIPEGAMVTMDFRADRLNLYLDRRGRIARVRCG